MNKAAMRTLDILTYVSGSRRPVTPKAISEALNIPLAGTNDILDTMVRMEYLMQPDKGVRAFAVGIRAFEAGAAYIQGADLLKAAKPYLREMSRETKATAFLAVRNKDKIVYLDKVEGSAAVITTAQLGSSKDMYNTGLGKAILASMPVAEVERIYEGRELIPQTSNTIRDIEGLKKDLFQTRQRGYAIDDCEGENTVYCIAAPIRNYEGNVIAAVSIANFKENGRQAENAEHVRLLLDNARRISGQMGYTGKDLYYKE
ncbi:IclR family transcriptional regulator [Diplocloster agilis]|uniref:IclR family transcriptional regulator n=1 Tax=Diplocloster agilis TaxID=2850323 RepID=A0A949K5G8_9FIRM|nr:MULTISPECIES: IclR family transcriptional regulator [Lachnospiraceae]MBU9737496.1 IclR family transcriptional regulator [Diplocloster agilis]MBU9744756.1 IclR family transcriptional regulator [Diplocloster agilis]MCU6734685.1 IclR family transcriptional regulator [Suonthocola fibrivorans]SCJ50015.1 Transcriptional regulator kdgR [uncultured Clostridium sp.]